MSDQTTVYGYYWHYWFRHQQPIRDKRVLILGNGFVGSTLKQCLPNADVVVRREDHSAESFAKPLMYKEMWRRRLCRYDVVVNTIADTDTSNELSPQRIDQMVSTNFTLPRVIADLCNEMAIIFVNISTACLLNDFRDPRGEAVAVQAESPYYATKLLLDKFVESMPYVLTVRPRLIYDDVFLERQRVRSNLTWRLQKYSTVFDCPQSVTHVYTLTAAIMHLVGCMLNHQYDTVLTCNGRNKPVVVVDEGLVSLCDLHANPDVEEIPVSAAQEPFKYVRTDSVLLKQTGFFPIQAEYGVKQAMISAAVYRNSQHNSPISPDSQQIHVCDADQLVDTGFEVGK